MTKIQWTDRTWNPTTGCNKVSQGCKNCYAEKQHFRLQHMHPGKYTKAFSAGVEMHESVLQEPFKWKKPCRVFVNSMSDLFHVQVPFEFIREVYCVMLLNQQHTFQILTKRPEIIKQFYEYMDMYVSAFDMGSINALWKEKKNIWLGTSVENQQTADERIPLLLQVPAAVRFLSCEPLLGPVNISEWFYPKELLGMEVVNYDESESKELANDIHWVIAGGESGNKARPMHPDWVRNLRDQCATASVPFFFKQWGEWSTEQIFNPKRKTIKGTYIHKDGHRCGFKSLMDGNANYQTMYKVGKAKSGNFLDGKQHLEFPQPVKH